MRRGWLAVALLGLGLGLGLARAESAPEQLFQAGITAIERGAHDEAIDDFELLSDRGFVHPDASFDRAVAYARRAQSPNARPGDLGRAAAALSETLLQRPSDEAADRALEAVRAEIARRRAREGASVLMVQKKLSRAMVELVSEDVWAGGAAFGSLLLTLGLFALRLTDKPAARLAAKTTASVATFLFVVCLAFTAAARHHRRTTEPAVVVASEARLLDEAGAPIAQRRGQPEVVAIPEGARVDIVERRTTLVKVEWGTSTGFVTQGQLRVLASDAH